MATTEFYRAIGVGVYEPLSCWRNDGIFCLRMAAPVSCHRCPKCGNRRVTHRGTFDRIVHAPPIGLDRTTLFIKAPRLECKPCEQVLLLDTASLSILCYEHNRTDQPAIELWNSAAMESTGA